MYSALSEASIDSDVRRRHRSYSFSGYPSYQRSPQLVSHFFRSNILLGSNADDMVLLNDDSRLQYSGQDSQLRRSRMLSMNPQDDEESYLPGDIPLDFDSALPTPGTPPLEMYSTRFEEFFDYEQGNLDAEYLLEDCMLAHHVEIISC